MSRYIISASITRSAESPTLQITPGSQINILQGEHSQEILLALASVFENLPRTSGGTAFVDAAMEWQKGIIFHIHSEGSAVSVNRVKFLEYCNIPISSLVKRYHKKRFLDARCSSYIFDGNQISKELSLFEALGVFIRNNQDDRPLFLYHFVQRLDQETDLRAVLSMLAATGRQVFIAIPYDYQKNALEDFCYEKFDCTY